MLSSLDAAAREEVAAIRRGGIWTVWGRALLPVHAEQRSARSLGQWRRPRRYSAVCPMSRVPCETWDSTVLFSWESLEVDSASLTDAQRAELDYRIARHEQNPSDVIPWQQVRAGLFKKP